MADTTPGQIQVAMDVGARKGECWVLLTAPGFPPMRIPMDPQVAFETGEKLARAAHTARFGTAWKGDTSYLQDQIKKRVTEEYRSFLVKRGEVMLNSLREDKKVSNFKLATELVEQMLNKVL